jgi:hypothetical protein
MKKVILCAFVLAVHGVLLNSVLAQEMQRYVVTYIRSQTGEGIRSATAVTVVNQSNSTCTVEVEWFTPSGTSVCTHDSFLAPGEVREFCSRPLQFETGCIVPCTPPLTNLVLGKAIVSSTAVFDCSLIAVEARVYYTTGAGDTAISAISNSKIVFAGEGNLGD